MLQTAAFDYVVVGAGPIGAALAFRLARDGVRVLLVEQNWSEPDRIVGELMQPAGCMALGRLGLARAFSGIGAVPAHGYFITYRSRSLYVPYMRGLKGVSFHHGRFVMNLRAACKAQATICCVEASAAELLRHGDAVRGVRIGPSKADGTGVDVCPRVLTFVCDGIASQFRRVLSPAPPVETADFFAARAGVLAQCRRPSDTHSNPLPMPHNGHVLLDGTGPVLLYQMSERETRVLADLPGPTLPEPSRLRAALRESLARAAPKDTYPGLHAKLMAQLDAAPRIRCIASKFIPATHNRLDGAVWIGDALNVRHPLTGGGMTVGLWDVVHLTELLGASAAVDARAVRRITAQWHWRRRPRALVVNVLSVALHALFAAETKELGLLREACFAYLARGGACTMQPSGFLSGLLASPILLVFHFFSVALLALRLRITGASTAYAGGSLPMRIFTAFYTLWVAACVILPRIWEELRP
ncbi:squalene epoxidase [Coemansia spiralis]|nr:squalene epoxidase [Coemansia spiralis]